MSEQKYEQHHVQNVYDAIAPHFSQTRYKQWPVVQQFIASFPKYSLGVDIGCGNGKYMFDTSHYIIGTDLSLSLLEITKQRGGECVYTSILSNPFRAIADFAVCIAVIHHLSTPTRRAMAISNCIAGLSRKGRCLLYVWAFEQPDKLKKFNNEIDQDIMVGWKLPKGRFEKKETGADVVDGGADLQYERYYHLFKEGELEDLVDASKGVVVQRGYDKDNWWCVVEKV